jgi:uncharacterized protein YwqG
MENIFKSADLPVEDQLLQSVRELGGGPLLEKLQFLVDKHREGGLLVAKSVGSLLIKEGPTPDIIMFMDQHVLKMIQDNNYFASVVASFQTSIQVPRDPKPAPEPVMPHQYEGFHSETSEDYERAFQTVGLAHKWPFFKQHLKPELRVGLTRMEEDEIPIGRSKIGGRPDLPSSMAWPCTVKGEPLSFLAQFNCAELAFEGFDVGLPQSGMLYFFYSSAQESWGDSKEDEDKFRCLFWENIPPLKRTDFPDGLTGGAFQACALHIKPAYGLPNWDYGYVQEQLLPEERPPYLAASISSGPKPSKILGHANNEQSPCMEQQCAMATNGYAWPDLKIPAIKALMDEQKQEWMLLFQLYSEDAAQMCWGDVGLLYFWIRKEDFALKQFDRCWMILQCG